MSLDQFVSVEVKPWMKIGCAELVSEEISVGSHYLLPTADAPINKNLLFSSNGSRQLSWLESTATAANTHQYGYAAQAVIVPNGTNIIEYTSPGVPFTTGNCVSYNFGTKKFDVAISGTYRITYGITYKLLASLNAVIELATALNINDGAIPDVSGVQYRNKLACNSANGDFIDAECSLIVNLVAGKACWLTGNNRTAVFDAEVWTSYISFNLL